MWVVVGKGGGRSRKGGGPGKLQMPRKKEPRQPGLSETQGGEKKDKTTREDEKRDAAGKKVRPND